jgi:hypothetical protein
MAARLSDVDDYYPVTSRGAMIGTWEGKGMNETFKTLLVIGLVLGTIMGVAALVLFGLEL